MFYSYIDQVKDMCPRIVLSLMMGAVVYLVPFLKMSDALTLCVQIPLGIIVYVSGSKLFHIDSYDYIISILRSFLTKRKVAAE